MQVIEYTCGTCGGTGYTRVFEPVECQCDSNQWTGILKPYEETCSQCKGKGYLEYAMLEVEEAEAILKHIKYSKPET